MPTIAGVDVSNWCLAAGAAVVLTPAAAYAYLLGQGRQRRAFFAATPQPEEKSVMMANLDKMVEWNEPLKTIPITKQMVKELGPSFGFRLPRWLFPKGDFVFFTADPGIIKEIQSKKDIFHSRMEGMGFDTTIPLGILALKSEGPNSPWSFHRRLVAPLFSDKLLQGYSEQVFEKAELLRYILKERIQATKSAEAVCDLQLCLKLLTLDIISSIGFGFNSNSIMTLLPQKHPKALSQADKEQELEFMKASENLMYETQTRTGEPILLRYLPHRYLPWRWARKVMDERITNVLNSGDTSKVNMLKVLQNAHEGERKMSRAELRDEMLTLLIAGHETTGYTTSWALYEVARHPEVQEKIAAGTSALDLGSLPLTQVQSLLPYTWMVWQEALRLHPTLFHFPRAAEADTTLGGKYNIPAGAVVFTLQGILAHSEEVWGKDSMTFRPERMENGYPEQHFPFGFGNRTCIGKRLAYVEGVYLLAFLVKNFRLKISETSPVPTSRVTLTHHADEGLHVSLSER